MQENVKLVTVKKTVRQAYRTEPIWQYDVGHVLNLEGFDNLPETFQMHYSHSPMGDAITQIGSNGQVSLPDEFAQTSAPIFAWVYVAEDDTGLTKYTIEIPVMRRARITNQEPTPVEQSAIDQAISALNAGVSRAETAAANAESSEDAASASAESAYRSSEAAAGAAESAAGDAQTATQKALEAQTASLSANNSATAAAESASAAAASAVSAGGSATAAQNAANTATQKSGEAVSSANSAAASALSAGQSAQTATQKANDATSAATSAQGSASAASGSATAAGQSATASAGSAAAAAQTKTEIDDEVDGFQAQLTNLSSALSQKQTAPETPGTAGQVLGLDSNLDPVWQDQTGGDESGLAPVIRNTASGEIASFPDGADGRQIDSIIVNITPVQDLHGQDAPYPPGGGVNKFGDYTIVNGYITSSGVIASESSNRTYIVPVEPNTEYTIKIQRAVATGVTQNDDAQIGEFYDETRPIVNSSVGARIAAGGYINNVYSSTFTTSANAKWLAVKVGNVTKTNVEATASTIQLEKGSSVSANYSPYSNLCPISGWTGANVQADGANLCPFENFPTSAYWGSNSTTLVNFLNKLPVGTYTLYLTYEVVTLPGSGKVSHGRPYLTAMVNGTQTPVLSYQVADDSSPAVGKTYRDGGTFTITEEIKGNFNHCYLYCDQNTPHSGNERGSYLAKDIQLELGSVASSYTPYTGTTLPISWQSVAGTVYGGTLDVISGVLTAEVVKETKLWSQGANSGTATDIQRRAFYPARNADITDKTKFLCNVAPTVTSLGVVGFYPYAASQFYVTLPVDTDGSTEVEMCYPLAEPVQYQLTPNQLQTLLGQNNLWSNCGSIESVVYSADTKTYVDDAIPAVPVQDVQVNGVSVLTDGVANVPVASSSNFGVIKTNVIYGTNVRSDGTLNVSTASANEIKAGTAAYKPIPVSDQHNAVFYGLSKVAGKDLKNDTVTVGTYPENAKSAIHEMLNGSVSVTGTTPTITALPGIRYVCGEVSTLTVNLPASGIVDVVFESGSTATVLTITPPTGVTLKWANGFDPSSLDANTTYEINICDGLGVAVGWT